MAFITTAQDAILFDPKHRDKWGVNLDAAEVSGGKGKAEVGLRLGWHNEGRMRLAKQKGKKVNCKVKGNGLCWQVGSEMEVLDVPSMTFPDGTIWTPERGITRVNVILDKRPAEPFWDFEIDLPPGAQLAYQPPTLTDDEKRMNASRPAWACGSYALYVGGVKLGHFPRPFAVDANGNWTWGTLNIWPTATGWMLRKAIDATWLANATYPVLVDDTFGYTAIGGFNAWAPSSFILVGGPHAPASAGSLVTIHMYGQLAASPNVTWGIYNETTSNPSTLLAKTTGGQATWPLLDVAQWAYKTIAGNVLAATNYYLAHTGQGGGVDWMFYYDAGSGFGRYQGGYTYSDGNLPDPFGSVTMWGNYMSIYATYTPTPTGFKFPDRHQMDGGLNLHHGGMTS